MVTIAMAIAMIGPEQFSSVIKVQAMFLVTQMQHFLRLSTTPTHKERNKSHVKHGMRHALHATHGCYLAILLHEHGLEIVHLTCSLPVGFEILTVAMLFINGIMGESE